MLTAPDNRHAANPNTPRSPIIGGRARLTTVRETEMECTPKVRQINPGQFLRRGTDEATIERNG